MKVAIRALLLTSAAGLVAVELASCSTPEAPPPSPAPVAVAAPPPPPSPAPPPPPPITVATNVMELASSFRAAVASAGSISPGFTDAASVSRAVRIGSSYEQVQFQQGAAAYAMIAALQEPNFVASVRKYVDNRDTREALAHRLIQDPNQVLGFDNVDKAAGLAIAALDQMGASTLTAGAAVKQAAYDVQKYPWSKVAITDAAERLSAAKDLSSRPVAASVDDVATLRKATVGQAALSLAGNPVPPPYTPLITRALALAALAALGEAGDENFNDVVQPMLTESSAAYCLNLAKLNLYECLSVSRPYYEDVFCVGQHAMMDTGTCIVKAAGSPNPAYVAPPPPPPPEPKPPARAKGKAPPAKGKAPVKKK